MQPTSSHAASPALGKASLQTYVLQPHKRVTRPSRSRPIRPRWTNIWRSAISSPP
jgi:hypothetical protein